jgi:hypothetical protein
VRGAIRWASNVNEEIGAIRQQAATQPILPGCPATTST